MPPSTTPPTPLTIERTGAFDEAVREATGQPLRGASLTTFQVNVGLTCNLACRHCHVESSPKRAEQMDRPTMRLVLDAAERAGARTIDITGGAPEMNPHFRAFVRDARRRGFEVINRTNLTILLEDGYTDLPRFFADHQVRLVASLPCYLEENVDRQRGLRVYEGSVRALQMLNRVGYGVDADKPLELVYNPLGPSLPPATTDLEAAYRRELDARWGIRFTRLITITNMPIGRFLHDLRREGKAAAYEQLLRDSFNPATVEPLMCRHQVHVSHDGTLHDCDFNYALGLPAEQGATRHIRDFDPDAFRRRRIVTGAHCFGCTAGVGSSCGGALA